MIYALTNPVKDGLVERAHHWPGVTSLGSLLHAKPLVATRPKHFFRDEGPMPVSARISLVRPLGFENLSPKEFTTLVSERVRLVEEAAARERRRSGARVFGRNAILAQGWNDRPGTREPRRQLSPRVAARSKWSRIEALLHNRAFRDAYAAAREAFIAGIRDVLFPSGTYWLRLFTDAPCTALPVPA